ncbi:MAG: PEP/pyruvate-binding domain-containing protein [Desulfobacterales bacterium]
MKYLVGFEDKQAFSPKAVGQKFFNLAKAARAGFAVPQAVAISTKAHQFYISHGSWPDGLLDEVFKAATGLDLSKGLSIRSSATLEDLEKQSFAGQYRTFLQIVSEAELKDKIEECWKDAGSQTVQRYLKAKRIHHPEEPIPLMGVIIQKMVNAVAAGIAFGRNPMNPARDEIVIEAVKGLAEELVSGHLTPYRAIIDRQNTITVTPPSQDLSRLTIGEEVLMTLLPWYDIANLVRTLQSKNDHIPLDIEWAIDEEKKIWLLQSRVITTLDQQRWHVPPGVWTRKIANDLWADRLTPFLANEMVHNAQLFDLTRILKILGIQVTRPTLAVIHGYLYVNCKSIANALAYIPSRLRLPDLKALFPLDFTFDDKSASSLMKQITVAIRSPALLLLEPGIIPFVCIWITRRNQKKINRQIDRIKQQHKASAQKAFESLQLSLASLRRVQISNQWPYFYANYLTWLLRWLMVDVLKSTHEQFLEVLSQDGYNTTIEIEKQFQRLTNQIVADEEMHALFLTQPSTKLWPGLSKNLRKDLHTFLMKFGCRSRHRTLFVKRWAEAPEEVIGILQTLVRHKQGVAKSQYPKSDQNRMTVLRATSDSSAPQKNNYLFLLKPLIKLTRTFLDLREEQRFLLDKVLYQIRLSLLALGRYCGLKEKILFLKNSEIQQLINGTIAEKKNKKIAADRQHRFVEPFDVSTFYIDGRPENEFQMQGEVFQGVGTSPGKVSGRARIVKDPTRIQLNLGEIIIAENTDPGWTPILSTVNGMVIEEGGLLNHCSIVARELGIPAVVGVRRATQIIPEGAMITIDGGMGLVRIEED